ncbi:type II toxin-antitoxin system PemK/MazF family toxin [Helcobacillus massiliensis]|uniref:type II toxin-antitoxin system PemK/MazF family toxin n=1 Tax=Helcobacillus massiliensis TaxID=521392 RepID=UPI0025578BDA|nr:type II toxin-antitoxin system PemK/MazF family toxin [Helcobacillus massiliensis]MDK7741242.1 type II toxin-antitoxin system PemK/MazF family toxin [Helcobacillus massiliensis]WOO94046.1 type II toxin-antitoxin system PemK/MazF family toxin [Helcobacillus massiliensis]
MSLFSSLLRAARNPMVQRTAFSLGRRGIRELQRRRGSAAPAPAHSGAPAAERTGRAQAEQQTLGTPLPDRDGSRPMRLTYAPRADGSPDPGEVVWGWVPFEEDPTQGKDRPVLVLEVDGDVLTCLMLTSQDRGAGDHVDEHGNRWVDIGSGQWDAKGRPSEVRVDRLIQLRTSTVRREGGRVGEAVFTRVSKAIRDQYGW